MSSGEISPLIPLAMSVDPAAAAQPSEGQLPNARTVTQLTPLKRLQQALAEGKKTAEEQRIRLTEATDKICKVVLSDEALGILRKEGYLNVDVRFKGSEPFRDASYLRVTASLDDLEVPIELKSTVVDGLKSKIAPGYISAEPRVIAKTNTTSLAILSSIHMTVSDCRQYLEMDNQGNIIKTFDSQCPVHKQGINELQDKLSQVEIEYQSAPVDELKVDAIVQEIFVPENLQSDNEPEFPYNKLVKAVQTGELQGLVCFRIAFNFTDSDFANLKIPENDRKFIHCVNASLAEMEHLLKKIPLFTDLNATPVCKFVHMEQSNDKVVISFKDFKRATRSDHVKMIAEYTL